MSICISREFENLCEDGLTEEESTNLLIYRLDTSAFFPIEIILLKKLNNEHTLSKMESFRSKDIYMARIESYGRENFIIGLYRECYGTVYELISFMERKMPFYLKDEIYTTRTKNIERIVHSMQEQRKEKTLKYINIIGMIVTVFFALPFIKDTFTVIRNIISLKNIDGISINGLSLFTWIILVFTTCFVFLRDSIGSKGLKVRKTKFDHVSNKVKPQKSASIFGNVTRLISNSFFRPKG